jgi:mono/diheme cytochrome c family protein
VESTGYKPKSASPESKKGHELYAAQNCASCHSIADQGGRIGPPLDGVGARRSPEFLTDHLTDPEAHAKRFPESHGDKPNGMPRPNASAVEIRQIVQYLLTIPEPVGGFVVQSHQHGELPAQGSPNANYVPAPVTASSQAGEKLYFDLGCAACHSVRGSGGEFGPKLDGIGARRNAAFIAGHITNPELHTQQSPAAHKGDSAMPPTIAPAEQIEQITAFLLTLPSSEVGETPRKASVTDYLAISYVPNIETQQAGGTTETTYEKRNVLIYAAGTLGRHLSFFVQPTPASDAAGFAGKWEMAQGLANVGGTRNFVQVRFGQMFDLRNTGFGATDRGLTETLPFIFQPANGFAAGGLGRGASVEYTVHRNTTFRVFGVSNERQELDAAGGDNATEAATSLRRSHTGGFAIDHLIGQKGLTGVSFQFAGGSTPVFIGDVRQPAIGFERYSLFATKTFLDNKSFERTTAMFGFSFLRDSRFLGIESDDRSHGYGYFIEVDTIPVKEHCSVFARYDQIRPTTLVSGNVAHGGTVGVIYDIVKYARALFEYRRIADQETSNFYRVGFQLNF